MNTDIRSQFVQSNSHHESSADGSKQPYLAYGLGTEGRSETGLQLWYEDGIATEVVFYSNIKRVMGTSPEYLGIMCTDAVYILRGNHLGELIPHLKEHKVDYIQAYNEDKHLVPHEDAPIVDSIELINNEDWWDYQKRRQEELRATRFKVVTDNTQP